MNKIVLLLLLFCSSSLVATPAQVILIRHGEKPATGKELSFKGQIRAAALVPYFQGTAELQKYGPPAMIFAQGTPTTNSSLRSIETMTPLANAFDVTLNKNYSRAAAASLVNELKTNPIYQGKMVIACFEHKALAIIAKGLGAPISEWPGGVYDLVWIINFDDQGIFPSFTCLAQQLLYGDSSTCPKQR